MIHIPLLCVLDNDNDGEESLNNNDKEGEESDTNYDLSDNEDDQPGDTRYCLHV